MASVDEQAMIRCAAMKAELTIAHVTASLSLLVEEIGESREPVDTDTRSRWATVAFWLSDRLRLEGENLADSLIHDELAAGKVDA